MINRGFCCGCGKPLYDETIVCDNCYDRYFKDIKEYLKEHKNARFKDVSHDAHIPYSVIELFIKNEDAKLLEDIDLNTLTQEYEAVLLKEEQRRKNLELLQGLITQKQDDKQQVLNKKGPRMRYMGTDNKYRK